MWFEFLDILMLIDVPGNPDQARRHGVTCRAGVEAEMFLLQSFCKGDPGVFLGLGHKPWMHRNKDEGEEEKL